MFSQQNKLYLSQKLPATPARMELQKRQPTLPKCLDLGIAKATSENKDSRAETYNRYYHKNGMSIHMHFHIWEGPTYASTHKEKEQKWSKDISKREKNSHHNPLYKALHIIHFQINAHFQLPGLLK